MMQKFNLQEELQKVIQNKQLIEIMLPNDEDAVAYVLKADEDSITIADISASFTLLAVSTYHMSGVRLISLESIYMDEFAKQIQDDSLYSAAVSSVENMKNPGFEAFLEAFADTNKIVEITREGGDSSQGRIVSYNDLVIVIDEYYVQYEKRFARTVINRDKVVCLAVNTARSRILAKYLENKRL